MDNEIIKHLHEVGIWLDLDGDEAEAQIIYDGVDYAEGLEKALQQIIKRLGENDSWLSQSIDCRNIAEIALGRKDANP